ncbi:MAG: hypothetical protein O9296_12425 [Novosphingobium sp.]|nr:hypothetical protein [Novosphingobium sp.]
MDNTNEGHAIMFGKQVSQRSFLDKAIFASVAAMLAMNVFVLAQQLHQAPTFAAAGHSAATAQA